MREGGPQLEEVLEEKIFLETRTDYCLGHVTKAIIPEWCPHCRYDELNKRCLGYQPIALTLYEMKPAQEVVCEEEK